MSSLVQDDLTRATTFFALAFGLTALGGLAIGDLRLGVEWGLALGVGFAVFAYFFVAPTALDEDTADQDRGDEDAADEEGGDEPSNGATDPVDGTDDDGTGSVENDPGDGSRGESGPPE